MEENKLIVEIISPGGYLFNGNCHMVNVPATGGEMGILSHHESVLTTLSAGKITIFDKNKFAIETFEIESGFAEMTGEKLLILVEPKNN